MKTVQKLEIASGLIALILSFGSFYILESRPTQPGEYRNAMKDIAMGLLIAVLPTLLMSISSMIHIFLKSKGGLVAVLLFGTITVFLQSYMFMLSLLFSGGRPLRVVLASSGILAVLTMLFAFLSRKVMRPLT